MTVRERIRTEYASFDGYRIRKNATTCAGAVQGRRARNHFPRTCGSRRGVGRKRSGRVLSAFTIAGAGLEGAG